MLMTPTTLLPAVLFNMMLPSLLLLQVDILQMHGTGTSLGDPIEIGAATAAFCGSSSLHRADALPLSLITSKSSVGHAEPAAGVVGLLHSLNAVQQAALPSLLHLRTLNPFVGSALPAATGPRSFYLPRQLAPQAQTGPGAFSQGLVSGVSSFAFQVSYLGLTWCHLRDINICMKWCGLA